MRKFVLIGGKLTALVRLLSTQRIMRFGELFALLVVYLEARLVFGSAWSGSVASVVIVLAVLLVQGELVRVGDLLSRSEVKTAGYFARFTGLGWAGTGLTVLIITEIGLDSFGSSTVTAIFWSSLGVAIAVSLYAFTMGRTRIAVAKFEIGNTSSGTRVRIATMSDLHLGDFVKVGHIRKAVELCNAQSPDIVLLLGDYVEDDGSFADELVGELTKLQSTRGVYAVLGNHDIAAYDVRGLVEKIDADPTVTLLRSAVISIPVPDAGGNTKTVQLLGINRWGRWTSKESFGAVEETLRTELRDSNSDFKLVASHHPDIGDLCAKFGVDLVVAGHSHGGQLAVPFAKRWLNIGRLAEKYFWGRYEFGDTTLIVTAGIGVGVIPARLGVPPEVTVIDIYL